MFVNIKYNNCKKCIKQFYVIEMRVNLLYLKLNKFGAARVQ